MSARGGLGTTYEVAAIKILNGLHLTMQDKSVLNLGLVQDPESGKQFVMDKLV